MILHCEMHQGNASASILADAPTALTFSIHAAKNFPFRKEASDFDIELPDVTGDGDYLEALELGICHALSAAQPDLTRDRKVFELYRCSVAALRRCRVSSLRTYFNCQPSILFFKCKKFLTGSAVLLELVMPAS